MWTCAECRATREKPEKRQPMGWHYSGHKLSLFCEDCWNRQNILRAISIPVARPVDLTWEEFREKLKGLWRLSTQVSNWIMTELYVRDIRREGGQVKMPPRPATYLYPEIRLRFPGLPSNTAAALERSVTARYNALRYDFIWTCAKSIPNHRYPTPFPIPNQAWSVEIVEDHPHVSIPVGNGERVALRLKNGGAGFRRQMANLGLIISGAAVQGQMDIYEQGTDVMCKMVAWLPKKPYIERADTLFVRSEAESIIVALNVKDEKLWTYNGDQVRRWSAEHRDQLQRWADDSKAEHRPVPPFSERRKKAADKYHMRMQSLTHQIAMLIAGYASRRKFATVRYDDTVKDYCAGFPWANLALKIAEKCSAEGVIFEHVKPASGEVVKKRRPPLAKKEKV